MMWEVRITCGIMHNMIVQDERDESIHNEMCKFQGDLLAPHPGQHI
jgi:hypothetical protein